jgi:hypothetical protein
MVRLAFFWTTDVAGPVKSDAAICVADQAVIAIENVRPQVPENDRREAR